MAWLNKTLMRLGIFALVASARRSPLTRRKLLETAFYSHSSDIPDADRAPMRPYPSFEKLAIYDSRRVRVPISFIGKLGVDVVVDQICNDNRLFALAIAILVYRHS
jgi:hypothetical protein